MKARLQRLRAELLSDRQAFEARLAELHGLDLASETAAEAERAQAALALHHAYSAIESLLERVARTIEGSLPEGADWHQALLESMALDIEDVRPRVLGPESVRLLRRLLGFRHFLRHAYSVRLDGERLRGLRQDALSLGPHLSSDLDQLDVFLRRLAESAE